MKTNTELRGKAVAGALLITTVWMAGLAALVNTNAAPVETTVVRLGPIVVTAQRVKPAPARMETMLVTAKRLDTATVAATDPYAAQPAAGEFASRPVSAAAPRAARSTQSRV